MELRRGRVCQRVWSLALTATCSQHIGSKTCQRACKHTLADAHTRTHTTLWKHSCNISVFAKPANLLYRTCTTRLVQEDSKFNTRVVVFTSFIKITSRVFGAFPDRMQRCPVCTPSVSVCTAAHSSTVTLWCRCADGQPGLTGVARHGGFPMGGISKILSIVSRAVWH